MGDLRFFVVAPLAVLLLHTAVHATVFEPTASGQQGKVALFVSIPLPGHLFPLVIQAGQLQRRGWHTIVATTSNLRAQVQRKLAAAAPDAQSTFLSFGDCEVENAHAPAVFERAANTTSFQSSTEIILEWLLEIYPCMYSHGIKAVGTLPRKPDVMVVDCNTLSGFDIAHQLDIPVIVNNPDMLYALSTSFLPPADYVPVMFSGVSIESLYAVNYAFPQRLVLPPLRLLFRVLFKLLIESRWNDKRSELGLEPVDLYTVHRGNLVLMNGVFGMEYAQQLPPQIVMVGPMIDEDLEQLSAEESQWLAQASPPTVYISMGTIAPLNSHQIYELGAALAQLVDEGAARVLWKLSDKAAKALGSHRRTADSMRVVPWVSSQIQILKHSSVAVFISHCGINSAHESAFYGTPLVCIPIFADQLDMAVRVADAGAGVYVDKTQLTANSIAAAVRSVLANRTHHKARLQLLRSSVHLSGGAARAADYIEHVADFGVTHLLPKVIDAPEYVAFNLDVYAVWLLLLWLSAKLCRLCCGACCARIACCLSRKARKSRHDKDD